MEIRSVTLFQDLAFPPRAGVLHSAARFARAAESRLADAGLKPQTLRLASQPYAGWMPQGSEFTGAVRELEQATHDSGFGYLSLGPVAGDVPNADLRPLEWLPDAMGAAPTAFFSATIASLRYGVSLPGVYAAARAVRRLAEVGADGLTNLRFAALASCPPWSPFFPAAYHGGGGPRFAVAVEAADLAVTAFCGATNLDDASIALYRAVETEATRIVQAVRPLARETRVRFVGIDFSLAPSPERGKGFGEAVECLGIERFGASGTLSVVALAASALDAARFPRVGFSGVMLPVLEDLTVARSSADGVLTVNDLLLYSAVCGTGLDTVPLPGDILEAELAAILLDVAALSVRLSKPLTARLMPIPGKRAGDMTEFRVPQLTNTRVFSPRGSLMGKLVPAF